MSKIIGSASESTGAQFFAALLPAFGGVERLKSYIPSFYARLEKVQALRAEVNSANDREMYRRCLVEEQMLQQVLDWMSIHDRSAE